MSKFKTKTSKYRGVCWDPDRHKWVAQFSGHFLGRFNTEENAFQAFRKAYKNKYGYSYTHIEPIINHIDNTVRIPLSRWGAHNYLNRYTVIDLEDYSKIKGHILHLNGDSHNLYVKTNILIDGKIKRVALHRLLLDCPAESIVDHIDGNGLNNRKINLRVCNHMHNMWNIGKRQTCASAYKGVTFRKDSNKWVARITCNHKRMFLGAFKLEVNAAQAYNFAAEKYHGEFANYNTYTT